MIGAGEGELKCYRIVHGVGREPSEMERPCTAREIENARADQAVQEAERMRTAQQQLKLVELGTPIHDPCDKERQYRPLCKR